MKRQISIPRTGWIIGGFPFCTPVASTLLDPSTRINALRQLFSDIDAIRKFLFDLKTTVTPVKGNRKCPSCHVKDSLIIFDILASQSIRPIHLEYAYCLKCTSGILLRTVKRMP